MQKGSTESKSESDGDSSLGSDEPQSSLVTDHVSDFGGSSAAAEEPTPLEQELPVPLPSQGLTMEVVSKMIADAASKREDAHFKELAEKEFLLIDQARRLSELKEQLEAQSSAAATSIKAVSESVDVQPYFASDAELQKVLVKAKMAKHGIPDEDELKVAIWQLLSPMPGFSNGKHSGPPSLTAAECLAFEAYPDSNKFDKKAIAAILGPQKGYGNFTHDQFVDLAKNYDSVKGGGPSFQALILGSMESYLQSIGASLAQGGAQFEYQPHLAADQLEPSSHHLDATGSPPIPNYGHPWIYKVGDKVFPWELQDAVHSVASKLAKNLSGNLVPISAATLRGMHRYSAGQCLLFEFVLIVLSCLSQNFSGLADAKQQVERLKTRQFDPYQLPTPLRMYVSQSMNLPIFRGVMAMRLMATLLQPDPLQSTIMEQISSLFSFIIFIEVGLLLQLSNLEAHVTKLRLEAERMLDGSYFKTFLSNDALILRIFFTSLAATLKSRSVLYAQDSSSNAFVNSVIDDYRQSMTSPSKVFLSLSETKDLLRAQIGKSMIEGKESNNAKYNGNPEMAFGTDQSSNFRASAMVVYPKQDLQASVKASGSRDPNSHIPVDKESVISAAKSNYTVNLKVVKNLFRSNSIDCNPYLEAVNYAPKGSLNNTLRWRVNEAGMPIYFDFSELDARASTGEYKALRQLQACVSTTAGAYWKDLAQATLLPSSITQGHVSGKGSKGWKGSKGGGKKGGGSGKGGGKGGKGESAKTNLVSAPLDHLPSVSALPQPSGFRGMGLPYPPLILNGFPPTGGSPYSNSYGIPGFDADAFLQFQQFQAKNAAAGSAAQLESKPKHLLASSAASFPAKGIPDDPVLVQRGPKQPRHDEHVNHMSNFKNFQIFCSENDDKFPVAESMQLYAAQQEAGSSYLVIDSETGNLADLSLERHTRPFRSKMTSRPSKYRWGDEASDDADEHTSSF